MSKTEYLMEALDYALEEQGITLTREQCRAVAEDLEVSIDNMSMAFGEHCIPNPMIAEMKSMEKRYENQIKDIQSEARAYKDEMCRLAKVDPHNVWVRDGEVWQWKPQI